MMDIDKRLDVIEGNQKAHDQRDVERFAGVHDTLKDMKENHLFHIEKDIAQLKDDFISMKTDMGWLKWGVTALLGGVGVIFIALVIRGL